MFINYYNIFYFFYYNILFYICISTKQLIMTRQKPGRKSIPDADKVKMCSAYLKENEKKAIVKVHGSLTNAVRTLILPTLKIN